MIVPEYKRINNKSRKVCESCTRFVCVTEVHGEEILKNEA